MAGRLVGRCSGAGPASFVGSPILQLENHNPAGRPGELRPSYLRKVDEDMDATVTMLEYIFLASSSIFISLQAFSFAPLLGWLYIVFVLAQLSGWLKLRPVDGAMVFASPLSLFNAFFYFTILLSKITNAQASSGNAVASSTTSYRAIYTVPAAADVGQPVIPNILDPQAVDAQAVCPGYIGSNVSRTELGLDATLTLAGPACNVYGTDIETLSLTVEYQSADRLAVRIVPADIDASNISHYILNDSLVYQPSADADANITSLTNDLNFVWSNEPTFSFSVYRVSTGDMLFSTSGTKLVFENQFIEFASVLPENYNLYGLGESIHAYRLGNNFTKTFWAADAGDVID